MIWKERRVSTHEGGAETVTHRWGRTDGRNQDNEEGKKRRGNTRQTERNKHIQATQQSSMEIFYWVMLGPGSAFYVKLSGVAQAVLLWGFYGHFGHYMEKIMQYCSNLRACSFPGTTTKKIIITITMWQGTDGGLIPSKVWIKSVVWGCEWTQTQTQGDKNSLFGQAGKNTKHSNWRRKRRIR